MNPALSMAHGTGVFRRLASLTFLGVLALSVVCASAGAPGTIEIEFLHTNDLHGYLKPTPGGRGGAGAIASLIAKAKERARTEPSFDVVVTDSGDLFGGTPEDNLSRGTMMADFVTGAGYDLFTFGNHDFGYGMATLRQTIGRMRAHGMAVVAANVVPSPGSVDPALLCTDAVMVYRKDIPIGIVGMTMPGLERVALEESIGGLSFSETSPPIAERVARLKAQGASAVILLSHVGYDNGIYIDDLKIASEVDGLTAILGGHTHDLIRTPLVEPKHKTLIAQTGSRGRFMGSLTLVFDAKTKRPVEVDGTGMIDYRYKIVDLNTVPSSHPLAEKLRQRYWDPIAEKLAEKVGESEVGFSRALYKTESPMGNLMADALLAAAKTADLAVSAVSEIRADLKPGVLRTSDLFACVPFENEVVRVPMTGQTLLQLFNVTYGPGRRFLNLAGARVEVDTRLAAGHRVVAFTIGGKPLDESRTYIVATTDFVAQGKGGFSVQGARTPCERVGLTNRDALAAYIHSLGRLTFSSIVEGRLVDRMLSAQIGRATRPFGCDPGAGPSVQDLVALSVLGSPPRGDLAVIDGSRIRWPLASSGPITGRDLCEIAPFDDELVLLEVTGVQLVSLAKSFAAGKHSSAHVAGANLVVDHGDARLLIGDAPPVASRTYRLVTTDRLLEGPRGFEGMLALKSAAQPMSMSLRSSLEAWVCQMTPIGPEDFPSRPAVVSDQPVERTVGRMLRFDKLQR